MRTHFVDLHLNGFARVYLFAEEEVSAVCVVVESLSQKLTLFPLVEKLLESLLLLCFFIFPRRSVPAVFFVFLFCAGGVFAGGGQQS